MKRRSFFGALFESCALAILPGGLAAHISDHMITPSSAPTILARIAAGTEERLQPTASFDTYTAVLPGPASVSSETKNEIRAVLLQTSPVAGFQYRQGGLLWALMRRGDRLALVREPNNGYDDKAVRIDWSRLGHGYVPRIENHAVSQMLDGGEKLAARIVELRNSGNPWKRVRVAIEVAV